MRLVSADAKRYVDVGNYEIWFSVYSTVEKRLGLFKRHIPLVIDFLVNGQCETNNALDTARQFNLLRDELAKYSPEKAVYDMHMMSKKAPWADNLSPVTTSCANLYTTTDGKDLLYEVVCILTYAHYAKVSVVSE